MGVEGPKGGKEGDIKSVLFEEVNLIFRLRNNFCTSLKILYLHISAIFLNFTLLMHDKMFLRFLFLLLFSVFPACFSDLNAQGFALHPLSEQCAESEELQLFELLTEYRRIHGLPPVPISKSLSYVARVHAMDLAFNRPDFGGCNPHSWSEKGSWKPCCYARDEKRLACMNDKPKELTSYRAKAWEIVYEGGETAKAIDAFDLWKDIGVFRDYLLNTGKWTKPWKAVGIGFYGDYATVWFGEGDDPEKTYFGCGADSSQLNKPQEVESPESSESRLSAPHRPVYQIITISLNSLEKANHEVVRMRNMGYANAKIVPSGSNFRISIAEFQTQAEAQKALAGFKENFPSAWVLKPE
ncbi:MAG: hypothetical protein CVT94_18160 [Bacteroidetes bacterium HGW-Bacteroidetes-11]|jgi:hypothetical protein|nr:MAG: hypothetical protein CVT94_18160 [Bacteroidetes bacterium HGW-Bacteroidetes-11]